MTENVVVLGSGYAGAGAIKSVEAEVGNRATITWISDVDHHLVLHEAHRCIRDPSIQQKVRIPIEEIKGSQTKFVQAEVTGLDLDDRTVELSDHDDVSYDYCVVGIGSSTAFFGIDGLERHSHTLKSLRDALDIHDDIKRASKDASRTEPAQVVVGGAGLSGIQSAGEIAVFRDQYRAPIDIHLVEGLDSVFPPGDPEVQGKLTKLLNEKNIEIHTGEFITEVDGETVYIGDEKELDYDVLLWTGGITGREMAASVDLDQDERSHRFQAESTFETSDERVFAIGDTALIEQPSGDGAPPTAQAAWQAAEVVGENISRSIEGRPLRSWTYDDKGTAISVGNSAVASDVVGVPFDTFGGYGAKALKKGIAAKWISQITDYKRAIKAWPDM